jgi:acyl carrier protein
LAHQPFFSRLDMGDARGAPSGRARIREELAQATTTDRPLRLERYLQEQIARVLRRGVGSIEPRTPFSALGMDSLMSLELRNRLEPDLGLKLPATLTWRCPTLESLVPHLLEQLELAGPASPVLASPPPSSSGDAGALVERVAGLSDEEVERLLAEKMRG